MPFYSPYYCSDFYVILLFSICTSTLAIKKALCGLGMLCGIIDLGGASIHAWMLEKRYLCIQTAMAELLPIVN